MREKEREIIRVPKEKLMEEERNLDENMRKKIEGLHISL